jgi:diphosphomevalonate decarboxylase
MSLRVTAAAHPSLALVKYWGNVDDALNIPANSSISVNLGSARTTATVAFVPDLERDKVAIDGQAAQGEAYDRVVRHLDRVRALVQAKGLASAGQRAVVESHNNFPASAGIASSASAFAALSLAAAKAAGLDLDERQLSILARKGSGSACRSIPGGFVEWEAGDSDETSFARQIAPASHWDLRVTTVILDERAKTVSSTAGHRVARTSPFYRARLGALPRTLETVRQALLDRDFDTLGRATEREAVSMHVVMMTSFVEGQDWLSGIYYWQPETLALIHAVQAWRRDGLAVYFTIDAGHNVHLLCEAQRQAELEQALDRLLPDPGGRYLVSEPGGGAWIVAEEGFDNSNTCSYNDRQATVS